MSEFTKGEWKIDKDFDIYIDKNNDKQYIAIIYFGVFFSREIRANARLIAAAPEMYQLLHDELTGEAGGTLSSAHESKVRKLLTKIDGED